jgi:hypothetical protein
MTDQVKTQTLTDANGKPFIQAEELCERISATIDISAQDYAIGYAAVFGALEQLKSQYQARVALVVQRQSPLELLAIGASVEQAQSAKAAQEAEALREAQKAPRPLPGKAPTKAPRPASEKKPAAIPARKMRLIK